MGIFTSRKRRTEDAEQERLMLAQTNANRLRIFLPAVIAGLDTEGFQYAKRAIGMYLAIAGWPSLTGFIYQLGSFEADLAAVTSGDKGRIMDRAYALASMTHLLNILAKPMTMNDVRDMQTFACTLMAWWGLGCASEEPEHPVVRLMHHFGGHPFSTDNIEAILARQIQIRGRITPEAIKVWKQAEQAMKVYGNEILATT